MPLLLTYRNKKRPFFLVIIADIPFRKSLYLNFNGGEKKKKGGMGNEILN